MGRWRTRRSVLRAAHLPGLTQLYVASTQPPSLDAIVAGSVVGDLYRDVFYPGGIQNVGFGHLWAAGRDQENAFPSSRPQINVRLKVDPICAANQALRGQNVSLRETIKKHPFDGNYWKSRSAESLVGKIRVPVLQIVSWQDPQVSSHAANLCELYSSSTPKDSIVQATSVQSSPSQFTYIAKIKGGWGEASHNQVSYTSAILSTETVMADTGSVDLTC